MCDAHCHVSVSWETTESYLFLRDFLYRSRHVLSGCWNFSKLQERCPPLDVFLAEGSMFKMRSFQLDAP